MVESMDSSTTFILPLYTLKTFHRYTEFLLNVILIVSHIIGISQIYHLSINRFGSFPIKKSEKFNNEFLCTDH